ncbi:alpha/beta hydrolase [Blastococcus mobilis]|uniref:TAP-like protein n=1 Tax=Blastococcus mobilis TaxID=1938746 RepID=A0A238X811_9ACTN|nr:alpha/beta hydrolase [Blastococcus mobilis]SNR54850.1 TAP-like protein [Blastococcus mobilis]
MTSGRTSVLSGLTALLVAVAPAVAAANPPALPLLPDGPVPELSWTQCGTTSDAVAAGVQCATAALPMDYDQPQGTQVHIAVARVPATDPTQRIGSLFFNFGGPGAPAVAYLQSTGAGIFSALNARFDIIAFDPRGAGQSEPSIDCRVDATTEGLVPRPAPTPFDLDAGALVARAQRYVDSCLGNNGEILQHVSTANVARDMDALRAAVGDQRLSYLGFSYGTFLGATYAALFPDRYRALVLDAPVDPQQWIHDPVSLSATQLVAFERALDRFLAACAADQTACSGFGDGDPSTAYDALLASTAATPIPAPRYTENPAPVTVDDIRDATLQLLYAKRFWGLLGAALAQAESGDGSLIRLIMDRVVAPRDDPRQDRFFAIAGSEQQWPRDVDAYLERGAREWADHPHFWSHFAYAEIPFALWPIRDEDAYGGPFTVAPSSVTPLVIATTYDPATPYSLAAGMVRALGNARLLTMEGDGHAAYGRNSACIDRLTESYLIAGTLPAAGTVCRQEVPFVAPAPAPSGTGRVTVPDAVGTGVLGRP